MSSALTSNSLNHPNCTNRHTGKMDEALKTFREMHVQRCWPDIATFNTLAAGYARTGDMERSGRDVRQQY